jgi:uncharacterized OB-fold protein
MNLPEMVRDDESAAFFDGTARGELTVKRCNTCGHHLRPVAIACTACHGADLSWVATAGTGTLVSWTVVHGRGDEVVAGIVELDEGPWIHARLLDADPTRLEVGTPLVVEFLAAGEEHVPVFRPRT